ncbi:MAG: hypothetical protein ABJF88_00105 [Rhodothermales bacterium]
MRPLLLLALFSVLAAPPLRGQSGTDSTVKATVPSPAVRLPFMRRPGDRATVRIVKSRAERDGGVLVDSVSGTWLVDTRVLAARPRGYTMAWTYQAPGRDDERRFDLATNTLEGVPIVFRTDATGQPYEIANGDSLRAAINAALREMAPGLGREARAALDNVRATAATDAGLEALLLADVERFHLASGGRYPAGRAVTYRSALPNPFGSAPIPAVSSFRLEPLAARDSVATVRWRQTPDTEALARILIDLLNEVTPGRPPLTTAEVVRRFGVEEEATYRVGTKRGQISSVRYRKAVRFGDRVRTERVAMETQAAPKPALPSPPPERP